MKLDEFADLLLRRSHRERCAMQGCWYGHRTVNACLYCGEPRPLPPRGISPIAALQQAMAPPRSADASDPHAAHPGNPSTRD